MEPIARRQFPDSRGIKYDAHQMIIDCRNDNLGMSVISAKIGDRWSHGWYCSQDTYEAVIVRLNPENPYDFDFVCNDGSKWSWNDDGKSMVDPKGWLTIEELGEIAQRITEHGISGWDN